MEDYSAFTLDGRVNKTSEVFLNLTYDGNLTTTTHYGLYEGESFFDPDEHRDPFYVVIPITLIYVIIFVTGFVGNISTCIVISRNKSMHTATNYYLFSLAVSDFMLLISGVPMELYHIWYKHAFIFGEAFCILRNAINEMSANATVLTITAFTIERYVAICHPFLSHTMSKLSRAIKFIFLIWILSIFFATPLAIQTGIVTDPNNQETTWCSIVPERVLIEDSFVIATILFFFAPMTLISILYMLIGMKLRSSTLIKRENGNVVRNNNLQSNVQGTASQSTKRVIKMLVAVVICFFLSWFPFHAQRLVFMYVTYSGNQDSETMAKIYTYTTYISGVLYYVSTCINPILYNLMSNKFRQAFKETLQKRCCSCAASPQDLQKRQYRMLQRGGGKRGRWYLQSEPSEYSGSGKDEYYSSSTQKQSIETITASRNASVKQLSKLHADNFIKSPSVIEMASVSSRFPHIINESDVACLSKVVSGSEINIYSDDCVQEIQLNIFPPSAVNAASHHCHMERVSRCKYCGVSAGGDEETNCLSIDVIQDKNKNNSKSNSSSSNGGVGSGVGCNSNGSAAVNESEECQGKSLQGQFSHIAFKRSNSILHISIGNSSKIMKRRMRRRQWIFSRLFNNKKECYSPDGKVLHLNNSSALNVINDNLIICINKRNQTTATSTTNNACHHNNEIYQNKLRSILDGDLDYGANELDFYMNEIKKREMS